ncbi:GspE/PulE family protein [Caloramator australicus]|uniref:Type IV fimbrial assembly, ATPase PilB n=1 Tax=Caloramator australicus RC3 TaxID=857293 RepID=I7KWN1_9CLOT|nr:GspE/PulE family protein [Caloramator australicus]CCJ34616.1 Type IV fimbrial assembly, ATPase PilB [Caloramator australicus RC3]
MEVQNLNFDGISLDLFYLDDIIQREHLILKNNNIIPLYVNENRMVLGVNENSNEIVIRDLENFSHKEILKLKIKPTTNFLSKNRYYDLTSVSNLLDWIIEYAVFKNASDVHIEPFEKYARVRIRIDGELNEILRISYEAYNLITNRIKFLANMDIAEKRIPLDGKFSVKSNEINYDLRVSTIPTCYSEKIVIRILYRESKILDLNQIGMAEEHKKILLGALSKGNGIILVTGPTGSGKSSTLYSILKLLNKESLNVMTIEDPVEYSIDGINQINVNPKAGLNFATGLRAILRQDPDVIMIGEIRDKETAEIAVRAAVTGHLVLSTFHTNDVFTTITRLLEMKIEPYLLASAINLIISQRLVKKICPNCKEEYKPSNFEMKTLGWDQNIYKAKGCRKCNFTGYKGRIGIFELLQIKEKQREVIANNFNEIKIKETCSDYKNLIEYCKTLVVQGITTFDEYLKIAYLYD